MSHEKCRDLRSWHFFSAHFESNVNERFMDNRKKPINFPGNSKFFSFYFVYFSFGCQMCSFCFYKFIRRNHFIFRPFQMKFIRYSCSSLAFPLFIFLFSSGIFVYILELLSLSLYLSCSVVGVFDVARNAFIVILWVENFALSWKIMRIRDRAQNRFLLCARSSSFSFKVKQRKNIFLIVSVFFSLEAFVWPFSDDLIGKMWSQANQFLICRRRCFHLK